MSWKITGSSTLTLATKPQTSETNYYRKSSSYGKPFSVRQIFWSQNYVISLPFHHIASYQISDLSISIVKEGPSSGPNTKLVTYKITGKTRSATDNANLTTTFLSSLKSAHIAGVQVVSVNSGSVPNQIVPEDNNGAGKWSWCIFWPHLHRLMFSL